MNDLSIIVCSYNTPIVMETCLKSWKAIYGNINNWLISENSTNNDTALILDRYNIPYFRNPRMSHPDGVDFLIRKCPTKFALLVDSDIIFLKPIDVLLEGIKSHNPVLAGEWCGDRGGKKLYPRIHPWFCFMRTDVIVSNNFYMGSDKDLNVGKNPIVDQLYDVGSKLFEEVSGAGLKILDTKLSMNEYFYHYEGMSWRKNVPGYVEWGLAVEREYQKEVEKFKHIFLGE